MLRAEPKDAEAAYRLGLMLLDIDAGGARVALMTVLEAGVGPWASRAGRLMSSIEAGYDNAFNAAQLGLTMIELDELETALRLFDLAITLDPGYADAHAYRGHLLAQLGRPASEAFAAALRLNPDLVLGHYLLGRYHQSQGLPDLARLEYARALRLDADNPALGIGVSTSRSPTQRKATTWPRRTGWTLPLSVLR
jgi:tetratricopeptide (TPR) repeat protein